MSTERKLSVSIRLTQHEVDVLESAAHVAGLPGRKRSAAARVAIEQFVARAGQREDVQRAVAGRCAYRESVAAQEAEIEERRRSMRLVDGAG